HLSLGLFERDSRTQSGDGVQIAVVTSGRIEDFGKPKVHRVADTRGNSGREAETSTERRGRCVRQSDARNEKKGRPDLIQIDDIDVDRLAEKVCIRSETMLPKAAADDDLMRAPLWIAGTKCFPRYWHAQNSEKFRRDLKSAQPLASIASGEIDRLPSIAGDRIERLR